MMSGCRLTGPEWERARQVHWRPPDYPERDSTATQVALSRFSKAGDPAYASILPRKAAINSSGRSRSRKGDTGLIGRRSGPLADGWLEWSGSGRERPHDFLNICWLRSRPARDCWCPRCGGYRMMMMMMMSNGHPKGDRITERHAPDWVNGGNPFARTGQYSKAGCSLVIERGCHPLSRRT
jgi:hypothetical protein